MSEQTQNETAALNVADLARALAKAQMAFPSIPKSRTVKVQTKTGGSYTFDYAPLDTILAAVRKPLGENGLCLWQSVNTLDGHDAVVTSLLHESGQEISCTVPIFVMDRTGQAYGSAVTYARRCGVTLILCLAADDDDDGNAADQNVVKSSKFSESRGAKNESPAQEPDTHAGNGAEQEAAKAVAVELQRLVQSMAFTNTDMGDVIKSVYNAKNIAHVPHAQIAEIKKDLAMKAALFPQIRDAVRSLHFDREGFDPYSQKDQVALIDKTHEVLRNKASLDYADKPLRAKASVWQEWLNELRKHEPAAA